MYFKMASLFIVFFQTFHLHQHSKHAPNDFRMVLSLLTAMLLKRGIARAFPEPFLQLKRGPYVGFLGCGTRLWGRLCCGMQIQLRWQVQLSCGRVSSGWAVPPCSVTPPLDLVSVLPFAVFNAAGKRDFQACFLTRFPNEARVLPASCLTEVVVQLYFRNFIGLPIVAVFLNALKYSTKQSSLLQAHPCCFLSCTLEVWRTAFSLVLSRLLSSEDHQ